MTKIRRRRFLETGGAAAAALALTSLPSQGKKKDLPNILFIHTDSWDGRALGCMDHPAMSRTTPNVDALADRGTLFQNAYCNNPICCPSRASMWSGLFTHHCEGWNNHKGLSPDDPTLQDRLVEGGYLTQSFGKVDYLSGAHTIRARVTAWTRSADIMRPQYRMKAPLIQDSEEERIQAKDWKDVDRAVRWLNEWNEKRRTPFFLFLGIRGPHPAFITNRRYLKQVNSERVTLPPPDEQDHPVMRYQRVAKNWMHGFSEKTVRDVRRIYYAMCAEVDAMVGRLMTSLEQLGLVDSTYVIFSSDHGENAMEHRQFYKMNLYESSARVPLVIAGPGVKERQTVDEPVSLVDLFPTVTDLAGLPQPEGLDGHTLAPLLFGGTEARPDWVLSEYHDSTCNTGAFMLRQGDWKYIAYVGYEPQLFNLKEDPEEVRNSASTNPKQVEKMDRKLRSIVDYEAVDAKVKDYDRRSFRQWRQEMKEAGQYEELMARTFSGWDNLKPEDIQPWTEKDEKQILQWLEG